VADFVKFDLATGQVLSYIPSADTPGYEGQSGFTEITSADAETLQAAEPRVTRWRYIGGVVREMTAGEKAAVQADEDAAAVTAEKDGEKAALDKARGFARAIVQELLPVVNDYRVRNSQAPVTLQQAINSIKAKIDAAG